jgi:DNA end-binding protein Ku
VSFNRINRKTGNRLKQQNVDSETGDVVPREDIARGYEAGKGQYFLVEDEAIEAVEIESTRTIEMDQFVPRNEIDDRYIDSPYYIAPDGQVGQDSPDGPFLTYAWKVEAGCSFLREPRHDRASASDRGGG